MPNVILSSVRNGYRTALDWVHPAIHNKIQATDSFLWLKMFLKVLESVVIERF